MKLGPMLAVIYLCGTALALRSAAQSLPADVKAAHWAASGVREIVQNGVMSVADGRRFAGDRFVTHAEAVVVLSKLARSIASGQWKALPSRPVPHTVDTTLSQASWQRRPITRYALASVLARFGDFIVNGLPRPDPTSTARGKSQALVKAVVTLPANHPAHDALVYLAANRMIRPGSILLNADGAPLRAAELSQGLSDVALGLTDLQTDLGHTAAGETPDATFHQRKPGKP